MGKTIFISAGEPSGDLHASALVRKLKERLPDARFVGMGGSLMAAEGVELIHSFEEDAVVGFLEAAFKFRRLKKIMADLIGVAKHADVAIMVDYPGFNLRLASYIKPFGVNTVYYIVPQVWAWGGWRVRDLRKYIDLALVILPFEEPLLRRYNIDARFVGHPVVDLVENDREELEIQHGKRWTVGLLPGSRPDEIRRLLPRMLAIREEISRRLGGDVHFIVSLMDNRFLTRELTSASDITVCRGRARAIMRSSDLVLLASGTASLEAGLIGVPMIVLYMLSDVSWLLAKLIARINFVSLVNILLGRRTVPEFVQHIHPREIAELSVKLLTDTDARDRMIAELRRLKHILGARGAARNAAEHIIRKFDLLK